MGFSPVLGGVFLSLLVASGSAAAGNVGVTALKLRVGEMLPRKGSTVWYLTRDPAIDKGTATDVQTIGADLYLAYENGNAAGRFTLPAGEFDGTSGWIRNGVDRARYKNRVAPGGPTHAKSLIIESGEVAELIARGLGDLPLQILDGGDPNPGRVFTALCVANGGVTSCYCSVFSGCTYRTDRAGSRAQLRCEDGTPDTTCAATGTGNTTTTGTTTTSTTTTSSTSTSTTSTSTTSTTTITPSTTVPTTTSTTTPPGVSLEISAGPVTRGQPIDLRVIIRNNTAEACRVVAPIFGLALAIVGPGDLPVSPVQLLATYPDGLLAAVDGTSIEVPAGGSLELPLTGALEPGAGGVPALRTVSGTTDTSIVENLWPFPDAGTYEVTATLRAPDLADLTAPLCQGGATASATIVVAEPTTAMGGLASAPLAMILVSRRRSRRRKRRSFRWFGVLAGVGLLGLTARAAHATLPPLDPTLQSAFDACLQMFTMTGTDTTVFGLLQNSPNNYSIVPESGVSYSAGNPNSPFVIHWNPNDTAPYSDGVPHEGCSGLLHELAHAREHAEKGSIDNTTCTIGGQSTGIATSEVGASGTENAYRAAKGLPERTKYGKQKLLPPPGAKCDPPTPTTTTPSPCTGNCGSSSGDPHLTTFDGLHYDFQGAGEFVLVKSTADDLEIQVRERPWFNLRRSVAVNTAIGARVAGTTVALAARGMPLPFTAVDGVEIALPEGTTSLAGGGELERIGAAITIRWPDGTALTVTQTVGALLNVSFSLATARAGQVTALLGDSDGDPADDLRTRDGQVVGVPPLDLATLYGRFGESWRISDAESLLPYGPGQTTATFTDRAFPTELVSAADFGNTDAAEALCRAQGVLLPGHLEDCILDVAATGEVGFTMVAAAAQQFVGDATFAARLGDTLANAVAAGARHVHAFDAVAGTPIDLRTSTPAAAGTTWQLLGPLPGRDGLTLLGPVPISDDLGPIVLPVTGTYQVVVDGGGIGVAYVLDLLTARPASVVPIAIGNSANGTLPPGGRVTYEFRVRPTRFVYPNAETAAGDRRRWRVESPSGRVVAEAPLPVDLGRLVLAEDGFYRLVIEDPDESGGDYAFTLIAAGADVVSDLPVIPNAGGGSIPPAGRLFLRFPATAGTILTFLSDTPDIDGRRWRLDAPDGTTLIAERGLWIDLGPGTLPVDGTYSLVVGAIDESGGAFFFDVEVE